MATAKQFYVSAEGSTRLLNWAKTQVLPLNGSGQISGFFHREALQLIDQEYYRDNIYTEDRIKARQANRIGDKRKLQDIVIPLVESQTETMKAYLASVFLTGYPLFGITADVDNIDAAKMAQAIVSEQSVRGNWIAELLDITHNSLKYFGVAEMVWCKETVYTPEISNDQGSRQTTKQVTWEGNVLGSIDPYNVFWDTRFPLCDVHKKAEFCGYVELETRTSLKKYIDNHGLTMNIGKVYDAQEVGAPDSRLYFVPSFIWDSLDALRTTPNNRNGIVTDFTDFENGGQAKQGRTFKNMYCKVTRYLRIVPSDFGFNVPLGNQVQIWKMVTVNDKIVIELERQSNIHELLPMIFTQPTLDGLKWISRSFAQKQIPMQDIASALMNGVMDTHRRLVSDRMIYDPSKISKKNMDSSSPSARIPINPGAYGQDITKMVYKIPFDVNQIPSMTGTAKEIMELSNMLSGQNKAQQGQFVKGNKTQHEFEDVQQKSSGRQQMTALKQEAQLYQPLKMILRSNIVQYQPEGFAYDQGTQTQVAIDPVALRKAVLSFTIVDGLTPEDKVVNADVLQSAMQAISASPVLQSQFNLGKLFTYWMKTQNADIQPFLLQPDAANAQLQQITAATNPQRLQKPVDTQAPPQVPGV